MLPARPDFRGARLLSGATEPPLPLRAAYAGGYRTRALADGASLPR